MNQPDLIQLFGFGPRGWGFSLLLGVFGTAALGVCSLLVGALIGVLMAWAKISGGFLLRALADGYTTVLRGLPDLIVIYIVYYGGSSLITAIGAGLGFTGFIGIPTFLAGVLAIGATSGAFLAEVFRGGFLAVTRGEIEAARACGMSFLLRFRRIIAPLTLRHALPGLGNVWQVILKGTALVSLVGGVEIMRQAKIGAEGQNLPFHFYIAAALLYLLISTVSGAIFQYWERRFARGTRRER